MHQPHRLLLPPKCYWTNLFREKEGRYTTCGGKANCGLGIQRSRPGVPQFVEAGAAAEHESHFASYEIGFHFGFLGCRAKIEFGGTGSRCWWVGRPILVVVLHFRYELLVLSAY